MELYLLITNHSHCVINDMVRIGQVGCGIVPCGTARLGKVC